MFVVDRLILVSGVPLHVRPMDQGRMSEVGLEILLPGEVEEEEGDDVRSGEPAA